MTVSAQTLGRAALDYRGILISLAEANYYLSNKQKKVQEEGKRLLELVEKDITTIKDNPGLLDASYSAVRAEMKALHNINLNETLAQLLNQTKENPGEDVADRASDINRKIRNRGF